MISLRTLSNSRGLALAAILALAGATPLGAAATPQGGTILVSTEPAGAAVYLDDQPKGLTPLSLDGVPAGDHSVRVAKDGFVENRRVVSVAAGARTSVELRMTQAPAPAPAPAEGGGEGWSTKKKALVGGGVAAAILGIVLIAGGGDSEPDNAAPTAGSIGVSPSGLGIAGLTNYTFSANGATDPENAPLTYAWTFGDGGSGSGATANHVFNNGGTFTVTLNVSDGTNSTSTTSSLQVGDVNGTWVNIDPEPGYPGGVERRIRFTQNGTSLTGTYRISTDPGNTGTVVGQLTAPRGISFEAKLKDFTGQSLGFTFTQGTLNSDLTTFTGFAKGYLLRNDTLLFGREAE